MPVDLRLSAAERGRIGAAHVIDEPPDARRRNAATRRRPTPDAPALVIHTSGTTGAPRPVVLTYGNWLGSALGLGRRARPRPRGERWLCALPLSHVGGLWIVVRAAIHATTVVAARALRHRRASPTALHEGVTGRLARARPCSSELLDAGPQRPTLLRCALLGGGPVARELLERARAAGIPVVQTYGMTEACSQVTAEEPGEATSTAGRPLPGTEVALDAGGEILVRGPTVASASRDADGLLHTGDLGVLDRRRPPDRGRAPQGETIVTGGENVAPAEVEAALEAHPAVAEAAVFGRADPEWGERVVAAVVLRPGASADAEELRAHAAGRLAGFKVPKDDRAVATSRCPARPAASCAGPSCADPGNRRPGPRAPSSSRAPAWSRPRARRR